MHTENFTIDHSTGHTGPNNAVQLFSFEGRSLTAIMLNSEPHFLASELGLIMGYADDGRALQNKISGSWRPELEDIHGVRLVTGGELVYLKEITGGMISANTAGVTLLTEPGVNLCTLKTRQPIGVRLRAWLATEVMPQILRTGTYSVKEERQYSGFTVNLSGAEASRWLNTSELAVEVAAMEAETNRNRDDRLRAIELRKIAAEAYPSDAAQLQAEADQLIAGRAIRRRKVHFGRK